MQEIFITIPLYIYSQNNDLYDHPTPLHTFAENETCSRLLQSILDSKPREVNIRVVLLYGKTSPDDTSNAEIETIFRQTFSKFFRPDMKILIAGNSFLHHVSSALEENGLDFPVSNIQYGSVRNLQLFTQIIFGNELQFNLDDDEIIPDEHFFTEIDQMISYLHQNASVGGIGGLYVDQQGNPDIISSNVTPLDKPNIYEKKEMLMQQMLEGYKSNHFSSPAPTVFGGLTLMTQKLIREICYDPSIQRGEDIDFLIHALFKKIYFTMDSHWQIIHKPPGASLGTSHIPTKEKKIRDVKRFLYEKEKINFLSKRMNVEPGKIITQLEPYPGKYFLTDIKQLIDDARDICNRKKLEMYLQRSVPERLEQFWKYWNVWPSVCEQITKKKEELQKTFLHLN